VAQDLSSLVDELRRAGGDSTSVEVKAAAGGLPDSLTPSLSALANLPGGGTIILGLDERSGFRPVSLANPQALKQGLAARARGFEPPVVVDIGDGTVDGAAVIVALVHECDPSAKPCRVASSGKAYLRGYDGDFQLSHLEEQAFIAARKPPMFDRAPVEGAVFSDLDPELVDAYVQSVRRSESEGLGKFADRMELLRRACVIAADNVPTVAGMLALGLYPQQFFPRFVIQAAAEPLQGAPAGARARNQAKIAGPIPHMLDQAMEWARRTFDTFIVTEADGSVHDRYAYPLVAFRELIANALIHRDLDAWSAGLAIEVRLRRDRLVIASPGGLYGINVERLGRDPVTSARNRQLVEICQHVYSVATGARAVEALASGIPLVTEALRDAGLPPARYFDSGIRFTVMLRQQSQTPSPPTTPPATAAPSLSGRDQLIYDLLAGAPRSVSEIAAQTQLSADTVRRSLRALREHGLVRQHGGRGRRTTYQRT
jgi:ATP-dependent DNA helicase RecG